MTRYNNVESVAYKEAGNPNASLYLLVSLSSSPVTADYSSSSTISSTICNFSLHSIAFFQALSSLTKMKFPSIFNAAVVAQAICSDVVLSEFTNLELVGRIEAFGEFASRAREAAKEFDTLSNSLSLLLLYKNVSMPHHRSFPLVPIHG